MKNQPRGPVFIESGDTEMSASVPVKDVTSASLGSTNPLMDQIIKSNEFQRILAEVELSARNAVRKEASENALDLFLLAVAGGALGGMVLKGTTGAVLGGLLAWYSMSKITGKDLDISELNPFPEKKI